MLHFVVEITFTAEFARVEPVVPDHRTFLQTGYDRGWLLMSGPQNPRVGGIVIARAPSRAALEAFFRDDPYAQAGVATYRFTEFNPVKRAAFMEAWATGV
ncbi:MAG: hypothetical protein C0502_04370 [Opitutus sp.]|nr:hypothetical protein [Opitutus sp.]